MIKKTSEGYNTLKCWDIFLIQRDMLLNTYKKKSEIEAINRVIRKYNCEVDSKLILSKEYDAIVVTDANQNILWVNSDFTLMTGYSKCFVVGKKPSFLHGNNTTVASRSSFRNHISNAVPFKQSIINYKKNQSEYLCEIEVHPLRDSLGEINAFLAFEREM